MEWQAFDTVWDDNYLKSNYEVVQFKALLKFGAGWIVFGLVTLFRFGRVECSIYNQQEDYYEALEDNQSQNLIHYLRIKEN